MNMSSPNALICLDHRSTTTRKPPVTNIDVSSMHALLPIYTEPNVSRKKGIGVFYMGYYLIKNQYVHTMPVVPVE